MATSSYDKAVKDSFPASDAPANTGIASAGKKDEKPKQEGVTDAKPTGSPTSDRYDAETAHHHPESKV
jgi:hypothetical protein